MKIIIVLLAGIFIFLSSPLYSQKDSAKVGVYVTSLSDFNIAGQSIEVDFWLWFVYTNDSLKFDKQIEITNAKRSDFSSFAAFKKNGVNWAWVKCNAVIDKNWHVDNFPFDNQKIDIKIEHVLYDSSALKMIPDNAGSLINPEFIPSGWGGDSLAIRAINKRYNTSFGEPGKENSSSFNEIIATVYMHRLAPWMSFFKMLTGVYVAFAIVLLSFFFRPVDRISICIGGLFASLGSKYIIESIIPPSVTITLFDYIHNVTFISIFAVLLIVVISYRLKDKESEHHHQRAAKFDRLGFWTILILYLLINIILVASA
jgi:hypothetical protein